MHMHVCIKCMHTRMRASAPLDTCACVHACGSLSPSPASTTIVPCDRKLQTEHAQDVRASTECREVQHTAVAINCARVMPCCAAPRRAVPARARSRINMHKNVYLTIVRTCAPRSAAAAYVACRGMPWHGSALRCIVLRAVPCRAVPCCAAPRCVVPCHCRCRAVPCRAAARTLTRQHV